MIKVKIRKTNNVIEDISISGHSGYAEYGYDIVCAGVSSVVTTTINGILSINNDIKYSDDGNILNISILNHSDITDKLINNMITLLNDIQKKYKKNIDIRTEEK